MCHLCELKEGVGVIINPITTIQVARRQQEALADRYARQDNLVVVFAHEEQAFVMDVAPINVYLGEYGAAETLIAITNGLITSCDLTDLDGNLLDGDEPLPQCSVVTINSRIEFVHYARRCELVMDNMFMGRISEDERLIMGGDYPHLN